MGLTLMTLLAAQQAPSPRKEFNPNPPGQIKDDSATDKVLRFLRANPQRFLSHAQIVEGTGCKPKSVDWAVFYLQGLKIIESRSCGGRKSPLYKEYRAMAPINELV